MQSRLKYREPIGDYFDECFHGDDRRDKGSQALMLNADEN